MKKPQSPMAYHLLVLPPQDKPVYFIVESPDYDQTDSQRKFLYESHSCPTNWLNPIHISHDGDNDPHGLIRYVGTRKESELPADKPSHPNDRDQAFDEWIASTNGAIPDPGDW